jgi:hypothetical protein
MAEPKNHVISPDTAQLKISGSDVTVKVGTTNPLGNTAVLVTEAVRAPLTTIIVVPPPKDPKADPAQAISDPAARRAGPAFGLALVAVITVTIVTLIAVLVMAALLSDHPTAFQTKAFAQTHKSRDEVRPIRTEHHQAAGAVAPAMDARG